MSIIDLTPQARNLLKKLLNKPFSETSFTKKLTPSVQLIITWCQQFEFEAGTAVGHDRYCLTRSTINKIAETLLTYGFAPLDADFTNKTRQQVTHLTSNEKLAGIKPKDYLVLVALTEPKAIDFVEQFFYKQLVETSGQANIELAVDAIDLKNFQKLIVIENRDSFNDWFRYQPYVVDCENALVIYRGDSGDATAAKNLRLRWQQEKTSKTTIYFGDFDLSGFDIALRDGYNFLLLPPMAWLEKSLIPEHYPDEQLAVLRKVSHVCPQGWKKLLKLMVDNQAGLRQQWMFNTELLYYQG